MLEDECGKPGCTINLEKGDAGGYEKDKMQISFADFSCVTRLYTRLEHARDANSKLAPYQACQTYRKPCRNPSSTIQSLAPAFKRMWKARLSVQPCHWLQWLNMPHEVAGVEEA